MMPTSGIGKGGPPTEHPCPQALCHQLDGWIVRRLWSHRHKRWLQRWLREQLPERKLIGEYELVRLISLVPSLNPQ